MLSNLISLKHNFLITGGAGYLGSFLVDRLIQQEQVKDRLIIYSRDELKHFRQRSRVTDPSANWVIGDVRDYDRLAECFQGVEVVIHAAAIKHLDACEQNPEECLKTNVIGTENVIKAAKAAAVKQLILISTDKAVEPVSAYGNSKQTAEKLVLRANSAELSTSVIRLGNLLGSSGSLVEYIRQLAYGATFTLYHSELTRFADKSEHACFLIGEVLSADFGGCVLTPKLKGFKIRELVELLRPDLKIKVQNGRSFEKLHEDLVSTNEMDRVLEKASYYVIPKEKLTLDEALDRFGCIPSKVKRYSSEDTDKEALIAMGITV